MRLGLFHWAEYQGGPGALDIVNSDLAGHYRTKQSSINTTIAFMAFSGMSYEH